MNIAPYVLARSFGWEFPIEVVNLIKPYQAELEPIQPLLDIFSIEPLVNISSEMYHIGLFSLLPPELEKLFSQIKNVPAHEIQTNDFIRTVHMVRPDIVLMFPDDHDLTPNITLFAPTRTSENSASLHKVQIIFDIARGKLKDIFINATSSCTIEIHWNNGIRLASCKNTGCPKACDGPKQGSEFNRVKTLFCDC